MVFKYLGTVILRAGKVAYSVIRILRMRSAKNASRAVQKTGVFRDRWDVGLNISRISVRAVVDVALGPRVDRCRATSELQYSL